MCSHVRLRDCFPSPHVAEHGVQEPHIAHCQQGLMLHSPVPLSLPGHFVASPKHDSHNFQKDRQ